MDFLVSVIIPAYNHAAYVKKSIESVCFQSYKNIELIVINDASSDNTDKEIKTLRDKYSFTYIAHQENKGVSSTLREGVKLAKGEYISFLASDDYWDIDKIKTQIDFMNKNKNAIGCCTNNWTVNHDDNILNDNKKSTRNEIIEYTFLDIFLGKHIPPASLLVKNIPELESFYDSSLKVEDLYLWLKLTELGFSIFVLPDKLAYYRIHKGNTTSDLCGIAKSHHEIIDRFKENINYDKAKTNWSLQSFRQLSGINKSEALKYVLLKPSFIFSKSFIISICKLFLKKRNRWV